MSELRPSTILKKIAAHTGWGPNADIPLPYNLFVKIMMGIEETEPVMTYERTVKEKYSLLKRLGVISETGILKGEYYSYYVEGIQ